MLSCFLLLTGFTPKQEIRQHKLAQNPNLTKESYLLAEEYRLIGEKYTREINLLKAAYADASGVSPNKLAYYNQNDPRWSNIRINSYNSSGCTTIGKVGCLLTSFTMMLNRYGISKNPAQVNAEVGEKACPLYWYDTASQYGLTGTFLYVNTEDEIGAKNIIIGAIVRNQSVIVGMTNLDTFATHYVVAYAYYRSDSDLTPGYIYLMDPDKWQSNGLDNDYMERWYIHQLFVYRR